MEEVFNPQDQEMVSDVFSGEAIPADTDLSEEASGTLAGKEELDNFVFPDDLDKNKAEQLPPPPAEVHIDMDEPKVKENPNGSYKGLFFTPIDHAQRIEQAVRQMAETDEELAKAIAEGKRTFEGCDRFIRNNMADLARECGKHEIVFDDDSVHQIARLYMLGYVTDTKSAVEKVKTSKPKAEKPKTEKKTKVVPLTPQIAEIKKTEDGHEIDKNGQISLF